MASVVDICNMALSTLGDDATVASIEPPEGSAQAEHCARWYPVARRTMLEHGNWAFALSRSALANVTVPDETSTWQYAYALPADFVTAISVLDPAAVGDFSGQLSGWPDVGYPPVSVLSGYTPQEFVIETIPSTGAKVLYTNQANAVLRYVRDVTDASMFSMKFTNAVALLLASLLAGPVVKGVEGRKLAQALRQEAMQAAAMAAEHDGNQTDVAVQHTPAWMQVR